MGACDAGPATLCVDAAQCNGGACDFGLHVCSAGDARTCRADGDCGGSVTCDADVGIRTDIVATEDNPEGASVPCTGSDPHCSTIIGKCTGTERLCAVDGNCPKDQQCGKLYLPWLQTQYGSLFSGGSVGGNRTAPPPAGQFNATYCIIANGTIVNFVSAATTCGPIPGYREGPTSTSAPAYRSARSRVDVRAILAGKFGSVQSLRASGGIVNLTASTFPGSLNGAVYLADGAKAIVGGPITFPNGAWDGSGAGLIVIRGGDLEIHGNLTYADGAVGRSRQLASPGFLVLRGADGSGGNIIIDPAVTHLVGAFYAEGTIRTGSTGSVTLDKRLVVRGVMVAKKFLFERLAAGADPAERITADGRALVNPPPGFADFAKGLPEIRQTAP